MGLFIDVQVDIIVCVETQLSHSSTRKGKCHVLIVVRCTLDRTPCAELLAMESAKPSVVAGSRVTQGKKRYLSGLPPRRDPFRCPESIAQACRQKRNSSFQGCDRTYCSLDHQMHIVIAIAHSFDRRGSRHVLGKVLTGSSIRLTQSRAFDATSAAVPFDTRNCLIVEWQGWLARQRRIFDLPDWPLERPL